MIQFNRYPIFINFSNPQDEERMEYDFARKDDSHMVGWLQHTGRRLFETKPGSRTPEADSWEGFVAKQFDTIAQTRIGKCLFDALNPGTEVWVVPFHRDERLHCSCGGAGTLGVFDKKQGGGIRLFFNRDDPAMRGYYGPDDVLFHEMVHAYRIGRVGWAGQKDTQFDGYDKAEEFLAIHMQNVYLDGLGKRLYYFSHAQPDKRSKGDIYGEFVEAGMPLLAIKHYLDHEPMARTVARWALPHPDFNPWRDYPQLLEIYSRKMGLTGGQMMTL